MNKGNTGVASFFLLVPLFCFLSYKRRKKSALYVSELFFFEEVADSYLWNCTVCISQHLYLCVHLFGLPLFFLKLDCTFFCFTGITVEKSGSALHVLF